MSGSKHTPGPWLLRYRLTNPDEIVGVSGSDRSFLADCATTARTLEEISANCRLIAAAPDLLVACEAYLAVEHLQDPGAYLRGLDALVEQMRVAVAKARGTDEA